jgi:hypothetical protein
MRYPIDRFKVASPCSEDWDEMRGDDRIRFCSHCNLEVHNFSAMTRREIQDLVARSNGRLCARYIHTPKGQIKTLDYTPPLVAIARRASRIAAGPLAVAMTLASASAAERRQPSEPAAAQAPADAEKKPTGPTGEVRGVVRDKDGKPIADADVTLSNDDESFDAKTNALGEYRFESVPGGAYAIRAVSQDSHTGSVENVLVIPGGSAVHDIAATDLWVTAGALVISSPAYLRIDYGKEMNESGREAKPMRFVEIYEEAQSIEEALHRGGDANEVATFGNTPLMVFASDPAAVKTLLAAGADPNAADEFGVTPMLEAAAGGNAVESLTLLAAAGAYVDAADRRGNTPLMLAAVNDDVKSVTFLLAAGADVNARTREGKSVLGLAIEHGSEGAIAVLRGARARE